MCCLISTTVQKNWKAVYTDSLILVKPSKRQWCALSLGCMSPSLNCPPCLPLLHSRAGTGTRAWVLLWWFPAVLWTLMRSCSITKRLWAVKEEPTWTILAVTPEPKACKCYSKIHIKYWWMSSLSWGSLTDLEKTWHTPSTGSPWPDGDLKSPSFSISMDCTVTQGLKLPKSWKILGIKLSLSFGEI